MPLQAQNRQSKVMMTEETDSVPWFNGFAVSVDLVGPLQMALGDYGQYEAALRLNLKDRFFPIIELGYGRASHDDDVSFISYRSKAPYGRIGLDYNLLKNKHDQYRLYGGVRYAFTSFKFDVWRSEMEDKIWGGMVDYSAYGVKCSQHWAEFVMGVDAKIWGPLHLGWSVRFRRRIVIDKGNMGNVWYVPGYGLSDTSNLGGTFNVSIDI